MADKKDKKDLLSVLDIGADILKILELASNLKPPENREKYSHLLSNRSMAMIFEKSSTRTRVSFEVAMTQLGGHSLFLSQNDLQLSRGETVADTARVLSRYSDIIIYRAFDHKLMNELAEHSTVPVINALDDVEHPCQIMADLLTVLEHKGTLRGINFAYVGDGNNVCNSLLLGAAFVGMNITVGCPKGYEPDYTILKKAQEIAATSGSTINITNDPKSAVNNCDVVYTDVWVSMGDEAEQATRKKVFSPFQINNELMAGAKSDCIVMHCLPAHRGEEIVDEVIDSEHSVIFDQAENRLHAQKAIILYLLGLMN
jgi:ornithine carbamoyltransferase